MHFDETHSNCSIIGVKNRSETNHENAKYVVRSPETGECHWVGTAKGRDIPWSVVTHNSALTPNPWVGALIFCVTVLEMGDFKEMTK